MTNLTKKLYNSKVFWGVISLLASLVIWIYITSLQNDNFQQTFRGVRVEIVGENALKTNKNMAITDVDTDFVTVSVSGPRRVVGSLSSSDLIAQIDVSKLTKAVFASQQYSVVFPNGVDTSGITITGKIPETVSFTVSNIVEKTVQVKGSFIGSIAEGFTAQKTEFDPEVVTVIGPEIYVRDVDYAWVTFGEDDISKTYSTEAGFLLMNQNGEECKTDNLTVSDESVIATLPILEIKNVPLAVNVIYGAGATEENTLVSIEPIYITLSGDSNLLNDYNQILLGTVDLTDFAAKTEEMSFSIRFDNELNNITGITEAQVKVEISGLSTRSFNISNIILGTVPEGFAAELNTEQLSVTLRGTEEELHLIKPDDIAIIADWSDFNQALGTQELPVRIRIDTEGTSNCGAIFDYVITVTVRKAEG